MTKISQMQANDISASRLIYVESENILHTYKKDYPTQSAVLTRQTPIRILERNSKIVGREQKSSLNESEDD